MTFSDKGIATGSAFNRLMRALIHVPKDELAEQERRYEREQKAKAKKPKPAKKKRTPQG